MNSNIELISYAKLAEASKARTDLPIRKYVLIANVLRRPKEVELEQHWFDSCMNKLIQDEKEDLEAHSPAAQLHVYHNFNTKNSVFV
ncbi:hypothetical protein BY458DRAFT_496781 [Sporodiniella umbellata]|nr:hypothetical protein BY458DRAFT_496781 [Sporodiniella umbellata]